jgi:hypothetical protein
VKAKSLIALVVLGLLLSGLAHADLTMSGYSQLRYNFWDSSYGAVKPSSFQEARLYLKGEGKIDDWTTYKLQIDFAKALTAGADGTVALKDALVTRKLNPEWSVTLGYTNMPFGIETPGSSSVRLPFEMSEAASKLFPGERDAGLYIHYSPKDANYPNIDLGYGNGLQKWYNASTSYGAGTIISTSDIDDNQFVARLGWGLLNKGTAGLSYRGGSRLQRVATTLVATGVTTNVDTEYGSQHVYGAHVRYNFPQNFSVQGEYFTGRDLSKDVNGWYGQLEYRLTANPTTVFYRYDTYDKGAATDYTRNTFGVAYDLSKADRLTLQIEAIDDYGTNRTNVGVQWQVKY